MVYHTQYAVWGDVWQVYKVVTVMGNLQILKMLWLEGGNPFIIINQGRGKALKSGGPQRINRIKLYGNNPISMKKLYNIGGMAPFAPTP